jgi:hypothetical protein
MTNKQNQKVQPQLSKDDYPELLENYFRLLNLWNQILKVISTNTMKQQFYGASMAGI